MFTAAAAVLLSTSISAAPVSDHERRPPPPPGPPYTTVSFDYAGINVELASPSYAVQSLNKSAADKILNFSFVGLVGSAKNIQKQGCHHLGDITIRVAPSDGKPSTKGAYGTPWAIYDSANGATGWANITDVSPKEDKNVFIAHDITVALNASAAVQGKLQYNNTLFDSIPVTVVRSWEKSADGNGMVLKFKLTNTWKADLDIGGLSFPMPQTGMAGRIEESVWLDPHVGGDHGFVEWVRVVADEQTLLATAEGNGSPMEAWRPLLEDTCSNDNWEWVVHSKAWADEWAENKQQPFFAMANNLATATSKIDKTLLWPPPHASPWPSWNGGGTVPITDKAGMAAPWNTPTAGTLPKGATKTYSIRFTMADAGPRTRNDALLKAGRSVLNAVPGYTIAPDMTSSKLFVTTPKGLTIQSVTVSKSKVMTATIVKKNNKDNNISSAGSAPVEIDVAGVSRGRCRLTLTFSDGSVNQVHYSVLPSLAEQVASVGTHWAEDAWLPREYPDPFGRSASVMPWDRDTKTWVLDDSRAYDVGLSDDAGGGNPLGFAIKVAYAPDQFQVTRLDDYVKWTLYGIKTDTAKPPYKALQIRPEDCTNGTYDGSMCGQEDGIRRTMYYYGPSAYSGAGFSNFSGHWDYNYTEAKMISAPGIEGGPNFPMMEAMAVRTTRTFNYPHHVTTYLSLYYASRYTNLKTYKAWDWYLMRAANTTLKFGSLKPGTGVMDDTTFREILRAVSEEAEADPTRKDFAVAATNITNDMFERATAWHNTTYPYGSEFSFDTTAQEAVVVWLLHFANATNGFSAAAERTVNHILSYMRSSATFAYNGGSRSWGDVGNNGKWQATSETGFITRGNFHYRAGLNAIPLLEWYKLNPDDFFLLEPALGAVAGQMNNIDETGAPSMMMHMEPHIQDFDPHSGDYGLGFFGCSLESASYFVNHPTIGPVCYLCNMDGAGTNDLEAGAVTIKPVDLYRRRVYVEPLALYLTLDAGTFASLTLDMAAKKISIAFNSMAFDNCTYTNRRLRVEKMSTKRPGKGFKLDGTFPVVRNAFEIPEGTAAVDVTYSI